MDGQGTHWKHTRYTLEINLAQTGINQKQTSDTSGTDPKCGKDEPRINQN